MTTQFYGSIFTQLCQGRTDSLMQKYGMLACLEEGFENAILKGTRKFYPMPVTFPPKGPCRALERPELVLAGSDADPTPVILSNSDLLQSSVSSFLLAWAARMIYG